MKYKYNNQWVDLSIKALDSMEIGCIIQFMGNTIPNGWLECDGSSISQSDYPDLYALIGGTLPNFKGRVLVGQDTSDSDFDTLGETGGSKDLQQHNHETLWQAGNGAGTGTGSYAGMPAVFGSYAIPGMTEWASKSTGTGNSGNLQPYAVVKHIIKALNTTPTMASIVNGYSTSTQDTYSCDYINGTVLYENSSGSAGNITLSDSINNYSYIEIYSRWYDMYSIPAVKLNRSNITSGKFNLSWSDVDSNGVIIFAKIWNISSNSITKNMFYYYNPKTGETSNWDVCYITKVVGYK